MYTILSGTYMDLSSRAQGDLVPQELTWTLLIRVSSKTDISIPLLSQHMQIRTWVSYTAGRNSTNAPINHSSVYNPQTSIVYRNISTEYGFRVLQMLDILPSVLESEKAKTAGDD